MEGTAADSIGSFRKQLTVLERAAPTVLTPANRLRGPAREVTGGVLLPPMRPSAPVRALAAHPGARRRRSVQRRRRDVLTVLAVGMVGTLLGGFLPGLKMLWGVHLVLDGFFVAYVSLLIRLRNLSAEREIKLRFLPATLPEPAFLLRRSAN
jgi:hypothetical protein